MCIFWKHGVWTPSEYQELVNNPQGFLPSFMVWDAGGGLW
jgi:hypothetical protein